MRRMTWAVPGHYLLVTLAIAGCRGSEHFAQVQSSDVASSCDGVMPPRVGVGRTDEQPLGPSQTCLPAASAGGLLAFGVADASGAHYVLRDPSTGAEVGTREGPLEGAGALTITDAAGHTLELRVSSSGLTARWQGGGDEFLLEPAAPTTVALASLVGEQGVAVQVNGDWALRVPDLSTAPEPPPAWLLAPASSRVVPIRGGNAYALVPDKEPGQWCRQRLLLLAPNGRHCGEVDFPLGVGVCLPMYVAPDGTVVEDLPGYGKSCPRQWWPGLLQ